MKMGKGPWGLHASFELVLTIPFYSYFNFPSKYQVLEELHLYPETWANMELTAETAYGFRLYRNESSLYVHVDKAETHVISFILHIDSSDDAEPWPILIEDLQGSKLEA